MASKTLTVAGVIPEFCNIEPFFSCQNGLMHE